VRKKIDILGRLLSGNEIVVAFLSPPHNLSIKT
jgi:hypothetical protein